MRQRFLRLLPRRLQRIDAQIERRAGGERPAFRHGTFAESLSQCRGEPFGIIAAYMIRRAVERRVREPPALIVRKRRRRMAFAAAERADFIGGQAAHLAQTAEDDCAGFLAAHNPGGRGAAAQGVENERRQRGTVLRSGEAVRKAPILQRIRRRAMARLDIGENFDRRRDPCTWIHTPVG